MIRKIAVLTSGGDSPGMNAGIRAIVKTGVFFGIEMYGIYEGYYGLYHNEIKRMTEVDVSGISKKGGTYLGTSRFPEFKDEEIRKVAINNLDKHGIEALVVIGGDGSYMGAVRLSEMGYPCIGVPGTIDNDAPMTDFSIGFDTALNTICDAVFKLRDTCMSHKRCAVVEVMGRNAGDLALAAGIAVGADYTIIPEVPFDLNKMLKLLKEKRKRGKRALVIIIAEGVQIDGDLAEIIERETKIETRKTVLGHIQRGGVPTPPDRILASRLGSYAVELLIQGKSKRCVGIVNSKLVNNDIIDAINEPHQIDHECLKLTNEYLNV